MKRFFSFLWLVAFLFSTGLMTGCDSGGGGSEEEEPLPGSDGTLSVTIDGTAFKPTLVKAVHGGALCIITANQLEGLTNKVFTLSFACNLPQGSHDIKTNNTFTGSYFSGTTGVVATRNNTGTLTLSKTDAESAEGTFNFTASNDQGQQSTIKDGKFKVKWQK